MLSLSRFQLLDSSSKSYFMSGSLFRAFPRHAMLLKQPNDDAQRGNCNVKLIGSQQNFQSRGS